MRERGARRWLWESDLSTWKAAVLTHKCEMSPGGLAWFGEKITGRFGRIQFGLYLCPSRGFSEEFPYNPGI